MNVEKRQKIERRIARIAVEGLLSDGYRISVYDGEETVLIRSTDKAAIKASMFSTDVDQLHVERGEGESLVRGSVLLVYGNDGWDVIADYSVNIEKSLEKATKLAEKIESEYRF